MTNVSKMMGKEHEMRGGKLKVKVFYVQCRYICIVGAGEVGLLAIKLNGN